MRHLFFGAIMATLVAGGSNVLAASVDAHKSFLPQDMQWGGAPTGLPGGAQSALLYGDPSKPGLFTVRVKLPVNYAIGPHTHPQAEIVTVLSGALQVGLGKAADRAGLESLPAGSVTVMPAGVLHYALVKDETVIQISGLGPWEITYADPKDDPRLTGVPDPSRMDLFSSERR